MRMKIKRLTIYGYGKWLHQSFDLSSNMVVFIGQNEAGKSTIQSFIRHMLFGFPKIRRQASYVPKETLEYGGKLEIEDDVYGEIIVERVRKDKGASSGELTIRTLQGEILEPSILDDIVKNIPLNVYDSFFSLQLSHLHELTTVNKEELNKYFLTIGSSGSDQLFHLRDKWLNESKKLFRPSGSVPLLNQKLDTLTELFERVQMAEQQQKKYADCVQMIQTTAADKRRLEQEEHHLKQKLYVLEKDVVAYDVQQEHEKLRAQLNDKLVTIPEDLSLQFDRLQIKVEEQTKRLVVLQERLKNEYVEPTSAFKWFMNQRDKIKGIMQQLPKIDALLQNLVRTEFDYNSKNEAYQQERLRLGILEEETIPSQKIVGDVEFEVLKNEKIQLEEQNQVLRHRLFQVETKLSIQEERIQKIAPLPVEKTKSKQVIWPIILAILSFIICLGGVFLSEWVIGICGFAGGIAGIIVWLLKSYQIKEEAKVIKQKRLQSMRQLEQERYEKQRFEDEYHSLKQEEVNLHLLQEQYHKKEKQWKLKHHVPNSLDLNQLCDDSLIRLRELAAEKNDLEQTMSAISEQCSSYYQLFDFYCDEFMLGDVETNYTTQPLQVVITSFKPFIDKMLVEEVKIQEKLARQKQLQRDIEETTEKITELNQVKENFFSQYQVTSQEAMLALLEQHKKQASIMEKIKIIDEQLSVETINRLKLYDSKQAIQQAIEQCIEQLRLNQEQLQQTNEQLAVVKQEKYRFEQDGTYIALNQEYNMVESETIELVEQVGELLMAAKLVEILLQSGKQTHIEQVILDAQNYFSRLTEQRYTTINFDKQTLKIVRQSDAQIFLLNELSQGTLEQLYVSIRLAFIKNISQTLILPIIIDDCFVNFDKNRRQIMYSILKEISKTHQVLYFTFNTEIQQSIDNIQLIPLERS